MTIRLCQRILYGILFFLLFSLQIVAGSPFREYSKEHVFLLQRRGELRREGHHVLRSLPTSQQQQLKDLSSMSVSQLKAILRERETNCVGCVERKQLLERALEVQDWPTLDERIAQELVTLENTPLDRESYEENMKFLMEVLQDLRCYRSVNNTMICQRRAE